ncbi:hypothetical protein L6304_05340 [bacterium]|nr:hypothetical protein [bacterium]MCG2676581.1 hypothetical protein [bacterium]
MTADKQESEPRRTSLRGRQVRKWESEKRENKRIREYVNKRMKQEKARREETYQLIFLLTY